MCYCLSFLFRFIYLLFINNKNTFQAQINYIANNAINYAKNAMDLRNLNV